MIVKILYGRLTTAPTKLAACMRQLYTTGEVTLEIGKPWYQAHVEYAIANGIIGDANYDWDTPATRAGYMAVFANALPDEALAYVNSVVDGAIPDVDIAHPQAAVIYKLYRAGIVLGVDDAYNCSPETNISRSEVVAILTRMMDSGARVHFVL